MTPPGCDRCVKCPQKAGGKSVIHAGQDANVLQSRSDLGPMEYLTHLLSHCSGCGMTTRKPK